MCLSREDMEDILQGKPIPSPIDEQSEARLKEALAIRNRLRSAFLAVRPDDAISRRITASVLERHDQRLDTSRRMFWLAPSLAAAAALIFGAVLVAVTMPTGGNPYEAQALLEHIHEQNLVSGGGLTAQDRPAQAASFFQDRLGFRPVMPASDLAQIQGARVVEFMENRAASYLVETDLGPVSFLVTDLPPEKLNFDHQRQVRGKALWYCGFRHCRMVAMRLGDKTYLAIGDAEGGHQRLIDLVLKLDQSHGT